jgi:serine/threonine protein phosphatase PrpC
MNIDEIITLKKSQRRKRNLTKIKSEYQNLIVNNTNNYNNLKIETNIGENDINERNNTENKKIPLRKFSEEPIINYKKHFNIDNITLSNEKSENETIYNNLNTQSIENNIKKLQKKNSKIKEGNYIKVSLGYSKAGKDDNKNIKTNQDSYFILEKINGLNFNIYGIFDGHGSSGHLISKFISNYLLNYYKYNEEIKSKKTLESLYLLLKKKNYSFIKNSIKKSEETLFESDEIDSTFSGTTCILIFILGNKIISINIGDSRAIMIKENKNYTQLSIDHKPENIKERERIEKNGGELRKIIQNNEEIGPIRVWAKGKKYPGIAMSRSIGDSVANEIGVFSLPEIKEFYIQSNCKFIVIGSDGLWEFLENEKVVRYVNKFNDVLFIKECIENLVDKAVKYWEKYDVIVDDITCILIVFYNDDL